MIKTTLEDGKFIKSIILYYDSTIIFVDSTSYYSGEYDHKIMDFENGDKGFVFEILGGGSELERLLILQVNKGEIVSKYITPFTDDFSENLDNDAFSEFGGYFSLIDATGEEGVCYYNPKIFYEIRNDGIKLDTLVTVEMNKKMYGDFHGYEMSYIRLNCSK